MTSLFASLGIAREALIAQQTGLNVTQNNISNVNTPGYTRQRADLVPGDAVANFTYQSGMGVRLDSIISYRDRLVDYRLNQELQRFGELSYAAASLEQIESVVNEHAGAGLQSVISAFFNSFTALANAPEDASLRQQVLARAEHMALQFRTVYEQLQSVQRMQELAITDTVQEINTLSAGIARLNGEIAAFRGAGGNENTLRDQRQQQLDRLAQLVDIAYFESESGTLTVMTRQGALLAVGKESHPWSAASTAADTVRIEVDGVDVTSRIDAGKLGALLEMHGVRIPGYLASLDEMAAAIVARVNEQHAQGTDLDGLAGGYFFAPIAPGANAGAARNMSVAITEIDRIAAAGAGGGPGDNANALGLGRIQDELLMAGGNATIHQYYANLLFRIGMDAGSCRESLRTQEQILTQVQNQRDAISGVNLDEEAIDLLRYQKAYEANARFIQLVDGLTEELLRLIGG